MVYMHVYTAHVQRWSVPDQRSTVCTRIPKLLPSELGGVPGVQVPTMILVVVVQSIIELPTVCVCVCVCVCTFTMLYSAVCKNFDL